MFVTVLLASAVLAALGLWGGWRAVRGQPVIFVQLIGAAVAELALVVQAVAALIITLTGEGVADPWTFWGYIVTSLVLLPVAAVWAMADRTRSSSVALGVVCLALLAMQVRIYQLWEVVA